MASSRSVSSKGASLRRDTTAATSNNQYIQGWELAKATIALNFANLVGFCDLLGLGAILPEVSYRFKESAIIEFATTSQLIGATVGQCILGYLSDIWGRRTMLIFALLLQATGALACALSYYSIRLAAFFTVIRLCSGVGIGSISNLVNISQNDFSPEDRRLKLQGIQGVSVALGSILGILLAAAFAGMGKWQCFYFTQAGLSLIAAIGVFFWVPKRKQLLKSRKIFQTFDWLGILSGTATVVCGLLLLCQHSNIPKATAIALAFIASIGLVAFVALGFKNLPKARPVVPFRLFRNQTIAAVYTQNILFGATYYTFICYLPVNLQVVREIAALKSSTLLIPYFVTHGICSTVSAQVVRWLKVYASKSYSLVFFFGFGVWTLAMFLLAWDSNARKGYTVAGLGVLVGLGTGCVFQNSVMAVSAQVDSNDKAVAIGTRNILRYFGGAIGTALSSLVIQSHLKRALPDQLQRKANSSVFDLALDDLSEADQDLVQNGYARAIMWVFICTACMIGTCILLNFAVVDGCRNPVLDVEDTMPSSGSSDDMTSPTESELKEDEADPSEKSAAS